VSVDLTGAATGAATTDPPPGPQRVAPGPRNRLAGALVVVPAGGLAGLAYLGQTHHWGVAPLAAGLFAVQVLLALAWLAALEARGSLGAFVIGVVAAGTADAVIAAYRDGGLRVLAAVGGVGLVVSLLQQLLRRPRPEVVAAISATTSLVLLELCAASLLALRPVVARPGYAVAAGLFGIAAAALVARAVDVVLPRPVAVPGGSRGLVGLVVGVVAAGAAGWAWAQHVRLPVPGGWIGVRIAVIAAVIGLVADLTVDLAGAVRMGDRPRSALVPLTLLLPVVLAGPAIYVAARYLLG
jgi:hypothetical protein